METRFGSSWKWSLAGAGALGALALLYFVPPDKFPFYPRCLLFVFTGWSCPGCGGLRAMHSLLHGDFPRAFQLNPLVVCLLPVGIIALSTSIRRRIRGESIATQGPLKPRWLWLLFGLGLLFALLRNLPMFATLKP